MLILLITAIRERVLCTIWAQVEAPCYYKNYEKSATRGRYYNGWFFLRGCSRASWRNENPLTPSHLTENLYKLDVLDPIGMKERLEQKSLSNFLKVIRSSLAKSGYSEEQLNYLAMLHMKRSAHDYILAELGLQQEQSIYLQDYGHIGQIDQILSLQLAQEQHQLQAGDIVTLVSAGIGYVWGAITIRWG